MPAKHRPNPKTQETIFRVYRISASLRKAMRQARSKRNQTVQEFVHAAITDELARLVEGLGKLHVEPADPEARPAKLPLNESVLGKLAEARAETGLPQSQLLLTSLRASASRKRRLPKRKR